MYVPSPTQYTLTQHRFIEGGWGSNDYSILFDLLQFCFLFKKTIFIRIMSGKVGVFILTSLPPFLDIFKNKVGPAHLHSLSNINL